MDRYASVSTGSVIDDVHGLRDRLVDAGCPADAAVMVDLIAALEELKSTACAVQAETSVALDAATRSAQAAAGVPAARQGRGVSTQIGLARRESPHRGQVLLGLAKALHAEMPHTLARLKDGTLNEFRATLLVRETACLTVEHRLQVDAVLCADPATLDGVGTKELITRAKRLGIELDPAAITRRARKAAADRCVTVRPAPDTMGYLTGLMPIAQAVCAYASLRKSAESLRNAGDPRSLGQLMADLMLTRLSGTTMTNPTTSTNTNTNSGAGDPDVPPPVPVTVNLTLSAETLAGGTAPALLTGPGVAPEVVPAEIARHLTAAALTNGVGAWFRRLYVNPTGALVAMTSRQRYFPAAMADFLNLRDQGLCATPYCDAPIRHYDHIDPAETGGTTTTYNGQGTCEACNHTKQAPGWHQTPTNPPGSRQHVVTTAPTGHTYRSRAPAIAV